MLLETHMAATPLEKAIEETLEQVRAELIRLYSNNDVGVITLNCGKRQIRVKATPERIREPVQFE